MTLGLFCISLAVAPLAAAASSTITIIKQTIPDDTEGSFDFEGEGFGGQLSSFSLEDGESASASNPEGGGLSGTVTETVPEGWDLTDIDCEGSEGSAEEEGDGVFISVEDSGSMTCTFTNTKQAHVTITKQTIPDDAEGSFSFSGSLGEGESLSDGESVEFWVVPGSYTYGEAVPEGWDLEEIDCGEAEGAAEPNEEGDGVDFDLEAGDDVACTFTNESENSADLTVTKVVINDNGGTKTVSDFTLQVNGETVISDEENTFSPGSYTVGEVADSGYAVTITGDCDSDGSITLEAEDEKYCTITNDDIAPTLTIIKNVINNDGGGSLADDFVLTAGGQTFSNGVGANLNVGTYIVTELQDPAYNGTFSGDCDLTNGVIQLNLGENKTCTITNDDRPRFFFTDDGGGDSGGGGPSISGNGGHHGNGVGQFAASATFVLNTFGQTAPGGFGGGPDVPFSVTEEDYICTMQRGMPFDAIDSFKEWLGGFMALLMGREASQVIDALKDPLFCAPEQAAAPKKIAPIAVHLTKDGVVVSTNPVWNACVTGKGLTKALIMSNEDTNMHRQGSIEKFIPKTCDDYMRWTDASMVEHVDHNGLVLKLDKKGRLVGELPTGYVAVKDGKADIVKK